MTRARFHVTYDQTTHESAEHGDHSDRGYVTGDDRSSTFDLAYGPEFKAIAEFHALTLREALDSIQGFVDVRNHNGRSFYTTDSWTVDYRTGTDESRALHVPRNITGSSLARVVRAIVKHCNGGRV